jgi:hypothetical protein
LKLNIFNFNFCFPIGVANPSSALFAFALRSLPQSVYCSRRTSSNFTYIYQTIVELLNIRIKNILRNAKYTKSAKKCIACGYHGFVQLEKKDVDCPTYELLQKAIRFGLTIK